MRATAVMSPPKPVIIDKPFFVAMVRPKMVLPYFAGLIAETHWSKPISVE